MGAVECSIVIYTLKLEPIDHSVHGKPRLRQLSALILHSFDIYDYKKYKT